MASNWRSLTANTAETGCTVESYAIGIGVGVRICMALGMGLGIALGMGLGPWKDKARARLCIENTTLSEAGL